MVSKQTFLACRTAVSCLLSSCLAVSPGVSEPPAECPQCPALSSWPPTVAQRRGAAAPRHRRARLRGPGAGLALSRAALGMFCLDFAVSDTDRSAEQSSYLLHSHRRAATCWRCLRPCCLLPRISSPAPPPGVSPMSPVCVGLSSRGSLLVDPQRSALLVHPGENKRQNVSPLRFEKHFAACKFPAEQ